MDYVKYYDRQVLYIFIMGLMLSEKGRWCNFNMILAETIKKNYYFNNIFLNN